MRCDPVTNYPSLQLQWASKGNCKQRKGTTLRLALGTSAVNNANIVSLSAFISTVYLLSWRTNESLKFVTCGLVVKFMHWKCMEYEVEGSRARGRPKRTWREVVQKDCQAHKFNKEDAMDRGRCKKLIKIGWCSGWWGLVGECMFLLVPAHPGSPGQRAIKRFLCCCVCSCIGNRGRMWRDIASRMCGCLLCAVVM